MLTSEIKDMKTWEEAELWLSRHGWGAALIEEQKVIWDEVNPAPIAEVDMPGKPLAEQVAASTKPVKKVKSVKKGK